MPEQTTAAQWGTLAQQARELARHSTALDAAEGVRQIVDEVYQSTKFDRPGGGGLDGKDGPERESLARVRDAADDHYHAMRRS